MANADAWMRFLLNIKQYLLQISAVYCANIYASICFGCYLMVLKIIQNICLFLLKYFLPIFGNNSHISDTIYDAHSDRIAHLCIVHVVYIRLSKNYFESADSVFHHIQFAYRNKHSNIKWFLSIRAVVVAAKMC